MSFELGELNRNKSILIIALFGVFHFLMDYCCALLMVSYHGGNEYILYNFLAFCLEAPIGALIDTYVKAKNEKALKLLVLVPVSFALVLFGKANTICLGLGNAILHCILGTLTIYLDDHFDLKSFGLGLFVGPGALGVWLGYNRYNQECLIYASVLFILAVVFVMFADLKNIKIPHIKGSDNIDYLVVTICLILIIVRSYFGFALKFDSSPVNVRLDTGAKLAALGKILGGGLALVIGFKKSAFASLLAAAICCYFCPYYYAGWFAGFFFNMTMPLTLFVLYKEVKAYPAFAFGLLTTCLFIGYLLAIFIKVDTKYNFELCASLCAVTLIGLEFCLFRRKKYE